MKWRSQRGASRSGCLLTILLLVVAIFLSTKVLPVFIDKIALEDDLQGIVVTAGAEAWNDSSTRQHIVTACRDRGFMLNPREIKLIRQSSRISATVVYRRLVSFPGYTHTFEFTSEAYGLLGSLK